MDLDSRTEMQIRVLSESRNRTILDVLDEADGALYVEELADRIVSRDVTVVSSATYDSEIHQTCIALHHERLPKLATVDLVEYDRDANLVTPRSSAAPDVEWQDGAELADIVTHLSSSCEGDESEIGVLRGRESIIEYECRLSDEAEEELFTMYVSTALFEDECVRRARAAHGRGVTIYVGSQNEAVREVSREHLPEATVWEPQLDWLNTPTYPRIGRLVIVDRRTVVLAVLEESPSEATPPEETALVASGVDNPLVILVRELLGPRLDHLDYQSDEFRSELPFEDN
ncbi:ArsR family transcriptional regulator [Halobacteria archaeon AArc-m2/3/4]|uniref:ArsR family transcriptional regulator n=1 Tax=Natronoglomus mannanivorans TaxID=2979990 RepID=A0ABT2QD01_9EURY|nr:ArsR family transcriptional regulator [Halobacteria archaeon AArc-m2/3/4]